MKTSLLLGCTSHLEFCRLFLAGSLLFLALRAEGSPSGHWPQWRGRNRDGISTETGLLKSWPKGGPKLVWKATGAGEGYSTVSVVGGKIFTMGNRADRQYVLAFDEETGKEIWAVETGPPFKNYRGNGPRGAPTVDGDFLYALGANGRLVSLHASTGEMRWFHDLFEEFNTTNTRWGISESPLVLKDRVLVNAGAEGASVVAFEKHTGNVLWQAQDDEAGYSSAIVADFAGLPQVVYFTGRAAIGMNPMNGELYWRYERASNDVANIATPLVRDGYVFVSSDYGTGCALLKMERRGDKLAAREVYFNRDMRNHHSTSVLVGDYLYGFSGAILTCMEFKTGKVAWKNRSVGKGSLVYADGHLYCVSERGTVGLVRATPEGYQETGRFEIEKKRWPAWSHPVVAGGRLYIRYQDDIFCFNIAGSERPDPHGQGEGAPAM